MVHPCQDVQSLQRGSYVKLLKNPFKGRLARVTCVEGAADAAAIGSTFMLQSSLHKYYGQSVQRAGRMTHCWHVCYLLAVSMTAESASSSCERIGSHLHALEAGESNISPARVADKLRLRASHVECVGSQRDENLIGSLVDMLRSQGSGPMHPKSCSEQTQTEGLTSPREPFSGFAYASVQYEGGLLLLDVGNAHRMGRGGGPWHGLGKLVKTV